ncbi:NAD(P)/FAD-dependent oxidoreductase [Paracoccus sp. 11-3]|uniref:Pyridine nucleotide-disulfide oxidoreductase domain-containing protein 2 n=1 Tax=Paracoccus amoyensis TaxID=2760093 RepID=A0A926GI90_9RHOB|nr:NAD(P)/FAD-dependent oxidoreductase [Paracoccus amoyensis]MBC9247467.1 NAD(P)/FAD-dependent oxidoreductase [Paracoccus amoyensis]
MVNRRELLKSAGAVSAALFGVGSPVWAQVAGGQARPETFDYVVAGAGHNSLLCAAYLAKAGNSVLVLEGRGMIGGGAKTAEVLLPGFFEDLCSSSHHVFARNPAYRDNEIEIRDFGYELFDPEIVVHFPFADGASMTVHRGDPDQTAATIERVSKKDAQTFRELWAAQEKVADEDPASADPSREALFFQRLELLSGFDAARQLWESPQMQAANISGGRWGGVPASDPGSGAQAWSMLTHMAGRPMPVGGSGMLSTSLGRFIQAHGGTVLVNMPVVRLMIEDHRCVGVECLDGSRFRARKGVVSTIHVKHLMDMAPRELWGQPFTDSVDIWQPEQAMFAFHYALKGAPEYPLAAGGSVTGAEASIMERPESIFQLNEDQAKGELTLDDYPLQIVHATGYDRTRAPDGYSLLKIEGGIPYQLKEGPEHWDAIKEDVADRVLDRYLRYTPNLTRDNVLARVIMSPLDIERMNPAMWRGSVHHLDKRWGVFAPYRMPIPGLYQTGACTAPGGSVTGQPGRNAAIAILEDDGKTLAEVLGKG